MHTDLYRHGTKANTWNRIDWRWYGLALGILFMLAGPVVAQGGPQNANCQPKFNLNGYDKGVKTAINTHQTNNTSSSCAWADVIMEPKNFLACPLVDTGPIALCYYSGVPKGPKSTPSCTFSQGKNAAQCDCYQISAGVPADATYSYVLITGILNKKVYEETVAACGSDGGGCLNAENLKIEPDKKLAPVCDAIRNKTMFSDADVISDYSPALIPIIGDNENTTCPMTGEGDANLYAACMTAPCKSTGKIDQLTGLPLVKCTCPTYYGPNQVGNPQLAEGNYSCSPTPHVWSSAYNPNSSSLPDVP
jgi:hypothetical protein